MARPSSRRARPGAPRATTPPAPEPLAVTGAAPRLKVLRSGDVAALLRADVVALPVRPAGRSRLPAELVTAAAELGVDVAAHLRRAERGGARLARAGEVVEVPVAAPGATRSVLLVGIGDGTPADWRRAAAAAARRAVGTRRLALAVAAEAGALRAAAEGAGLAAYRFSLATASGDAARRRAPVARIDLLPSPGRRGDPPLTPGAAGAVIRRAQVTVDATHLARHLANLPSNRKPPQELARWAQALGRDAGLEVVVHDEDWLRAHGCGGLLGVGSGSAHPPALVVLTYSPPSGSDAPPVVLVGKGITFDSGGLSLKRGDAMATMKTDMSGAAAVLAAMTGLARAGVRRPVVGLLALAKNMPDGDALRPGDVLRVADGTSVEVLNTDAEGRLVLADALGYAVTALDPAVLVDLATLTGAASLGLGRRHGALYATDETLAEELLAAAARCGEGLWRMPLVEEYRPVLDSQVADISHVAQGPSIGGGSITAALFLQRFAADRPWAHLDIAGPARADADAYEVSRGGTGYGVRLLLEWLAP